MRGLRGVKLVVSDACESDKERRATLASGDNSAVVALRKYL
jgi:hypothetical protein